MTWVRHHIATVAWVVMAVLVAMCFWFLHEQSKDFADEVRSRDRKDCVARVEARDGIRNVILFALSRAEDPNSPGVAAYRAYIDENLPPIRCDQANLPVPTP